MILCLLLQYCLNGKQKIWILVDSDVEEIDARVLNS
jgi:hypothetical protein